MTAPDIEPRHLRQALEFAVLMASEGQKFKPPMAYPQGLKKHFNESRIPAAALPSIRRMVDADEKFRSRIAAGAVPELVDPIGKLWLDRPDGWEVEIVDLIGAADRAAAELDAARRLKKADKRREAAEQAAARAGAEVVVLADRVGERDEVIDGLRTDVQKLTDEVAALQAELVDTRNDVRHARDRESSALQKLEVVQAARADAVAKQGAAEHVRDDVLADRAVVAAERSELARLAASAAALADQMAAVASPKQAGKAPLARRKAMALPGGVMGSSQAAAEFLMRSGASIVVDGYNVAKLAWPNLDLSGQRVVLLDAIENLVKRHGSDVTVVFDGADIIGASADGRRIVRVVFSPQDVLADDVIRDEVRRLPASRNVVVVTNDKEILTDTRAMGANLMSSDQLLALMR